MGGRGFLFCFFFRYVCKVICWEGSKPKDEVLGVKFRAVVKFLVRSRVLCRVLSFWCCPTAYLPDLAVAAQIAGPDKNPEPERRPFQNRPRHKKNM